MIRLTVEVEGDDAVLAFEEVTSALRDGVVRCRVTYDEPFEDPMVEEIEP